MKIRDKDKKEGKWMLKRYQIYELKINGEKYCKKIINKHKEFLKGMEKIEKCMDILRVESS